VGIKKGISGQQGDNGKRNSLIAKNGKSKDLLQLTLPT
jgi:hypothetical protein